MQFIDASGNITYLKGLSNSLSWQANYDGTGVKEFLAMSNSTGPSSRGWAMTGVSLSLTSTGRLGNSTNASLINASGGNAHNGEVQDIIFLEILVHKVLKVTKVTKVIKDHKVFQVTLQQVPKVM
jgi:hypothetical protein